MIKIAEFSAKGMPQSKGSMQPIPSWRAMVAKALLTHGHRSREQIMQSLKTINIPLQASNKKLLDPWMNNLKDRMRAAYTGKPIDGSFILTGKFFVQRPEQHYCTRNGKKYRDSETRLYVIKDRFKHAKANKKPDIDKLHRALSDAGEGIIWTNDSRIICAPMPKVYANGMPGVICTVWLLEEKEHPPEPEQLGLF